MDDLIFTLDDVQEIRSISVNIDDFDIFARNAQIVYLEKVLGVKLYNEMLLNIADARFQELLNGKVYQDGNRDINFRGVKPYLCYVWLILYSMESAVSVTPTGSRIFKDENAEYTERMTAIKQAQSNYRQASQSYERGIINFLRANRSTYPEFEESKEIPVAKRSNNSFKIFGESYKPPIKKW